jgi:hypothetical protein
MRVVFRKREPGLFPWLIRMWTRDKHNHCELVLGNDENACMISAVEGLGVRLVYLIPGESFDPKKWDVVTIDCKPSKESAIYVWALSEVGCKYDWRGIFFCQVFKWGWHSKDKWFCSEFCTAGLQEIGVLMREKAWYQSPGKLYKLLTDKEHPICVPE